MVIVSPEVIVWTTGHSYSWWSGQGGLRYYCRTPGGNAFGTAYRVATRYAELIDGDPLSLEIRETLGSVPDAPEMPQLNDRALIRGKPAGVRRRPDPPAAPGLAGPQNSSDHSSHLRR
ncbi:hypothetical protein AB0O34_33750 [Sphaerisporangium sp. NPDC088356]|uniref:hypothetical protein n=1 Tax=Sphaerisporangium sp. NPDC088356 TaxID=3154871 RepID=UPI00342AC853